MLPSSGDLYFEDLPVGTKNDLSVPLTCHFQSRDITSRKESFRVRKVAKRKKENPFGMRSVVLEFLAQKSKSLFTKEKLIDPISISLLRLSLGAFSTFSEKKRTLKK